MIEKGLELKNEKTLGIKLQSCKFYSSFNVSKLENSRKGDKSVLHILTSLTNTNLRTLQIVSIVYCNKR